MDSEDFEGIRSVVRDFVRTTVVPVENEIDERDEVPTDIREAAKKMGLFGFALPEVYGGLGLSMEEESRIVIELGYTTPALRSMFGTNNGIAGHVLMEGGTPAQKEEWLPKIASGDAVASFALTEADAGSDPSGLTTTAVRDGERVGHQRGQALHHQRTAGRCLHGVRPDRPGRPGVPGHLDLFGPAGNPRALRRAARPQNGPVRGLDRRRQP